MAETEKDAFTSDPLTSFGFWLEVEGIITGAFTEVSGLGSEHAVIDHQITNQKGQEVLRKVPGRLKWGDISLKRGVTTNMDMWNWRQMIVDGKIKNARKNGSVVMYASDGMEIARWNFKDAWPSKVSGPTGNAGSNDIAVEELTIVHEGIERVT